jgi:hypothetical protein
LSDFVSDEPGHSVEQRAVLEAKETYYRGKRDLPGHSVEQRAVLIKVGVRDCNKASRDSL